MRLHPPMIHAVLGTAVVLLCGLWSMERTKRMVLDVQVASLKTRLVAQDTSDAGGKALLQAQASPEADDQPVLALFDRQVVAGSAPTSTLDWTTAHKLAAAMKSMVPGSKTLTVMPTGSMKPMFDERALLVLERADFDALKVGDIVTYRHPEQNMPVVHRIAEKRGDKFWSKGDNNGQMDDVYITRENFQGRVFGIIYTREPSAAAHSYEVAHR